MMPGARRCWSVVIPLLFWMSSVIDADRMVQRVLLSPMRNQQCPTWTARSMVLLRYHSVDCHCHHSAVEVAVVLVVQHDSNTRMGTTCSMIHSQLLEFVTDVSYLRSLPK